MPVSIETLAAFALASFVLIIIPGPTVIMAVSQALTHGRRVALASVLGVGCGDLVAASLSVLGVGALLATSATVFTVVKWVGAAYLIYLGLRMLRAPVAPQEIAKADGSTAINSRKLFADAFLVTVLNPKGIMFFVAFLPQFIATDRAYGPQAAMLVATFVLIAMMNIYGYIVLASQARETLREKGVLSAITRAGGAMLVMAGVAAMATRRV